MSAGVLFRGREDDPQTLHEVIRRAIVLGRDLEDGQAWAIADEAVAYIQATHAALPPHAQTWADAQTEPGAAVT